MLRNLFGDLSGRDLRRLDGKRLPGCNQFWDLNANYGPLPRLALDLHGRILAVKDLQPFVDVADANAGFENVVSTFLRNPNSVVNDFDDQVPFAMSRTKRYRASLNLGPDSMPDGVLQQGWRIMLGTMTSNVSVSISLRI